MKHVCAIAAALLVVAVPALSYAAQGQAAIYTRGKLNVNMCTKADRTCHLEKPVK